MKPLLCLLAIAGFAAAAPGVSLDWEMVGSGFSSPLLITHAGDGSGRLFVVEQRGRIRILDASRTLLAQDFLNLGATGLNRVSSSGSERGLLGLAFHPSYKSNGRLFVSYTRREDGASMVVEHHVSSDPNMAETAQRVILGPIAQPFSNHNGGHIAFGPDGCLYIGLGDGGSSGDPLNNAQNKSSYLGKILRIQVESATQPYTIPPDNPFAGEIEGLDEIYAYGLRNPWIFSFDRQTGDLFAGDVGQDQYEEVDLIRKGDNLGWKIMEASHCFAAATCDQTGLAMPIAEYGRTSGNSITGGYVYRGSRMPDLYGKYIFGDFGSAKIWSLEPDGQNGWTMLELRDAPMNISSFGEDEAGEIYFAFYAAGQIFHLTDASPAPTATPSPTLAPTPTVTPNPEPASSHWMLR